MSSDAILDVLQHIFRLSYERMFRARVNDCITGCDNRCKQVKASYLVARVVVVNETVLQLSRLVDSGILAFALVVEDVL